MMTLDEWFDHYRPVENKIGDSGLTIDGRCYFFESYGEELETVLQVFRQAPDRVWTMLDDDEGEPCIVNGYHIVNRIGYFLTEKGFDGAHLCIRYID